MSDLLTLNIKQKAEYQKHCQYLQLFFWYTPIEYFWKKKHTFHRSSVYCLWMRRHFWKLISQFFRSKRFWEKQMRLFSTGEQIILSVKRKKQLQLYSFWNFRIKNLIGYWPVRSWSLMVNCISLINKLLNC